MTKQADSKNLAYLRDKDARLVRGIFKNFETPGSEIRFVFRKHKGDEIKKYILRDGETYSLPLGVVKHLNNNCNYPVHAYAMNENNVPVMRIGKRVNRFGFQSLEFMGLDDFDNNPKAVIVTAEPLIQNAL